MFRFYSLSIWAVFVALAVASKSNVGWEVQILSQNVTLSTDHVGDNQFNIFVDAAINITRKSSPSTSFTLNYYTSYYMVNNETEPNAARETLVHTETVSAYDTNSFIHPVFFDFQEPTQDILLSVALVEDGAAATQFTIESEGTVLSNGGEGWTARVVGEYDHQINLVFAAEVETLRAGGLDEGGPRDLGIPPISNEPELQVIPKGNAPVNESSTVPVPVDSSTSTTPIETPSSPIYTYPQDPSYTPEPPVYTHPQDPSVTVPNQGASTTIPGKDGSVTIIHTVTVCGCACPSSSTTTSETPSETPCQTPSVAPYSDDKKKHEARGMAPAIHPAYINARFTYEDRNAIKQPVRLSTFVLHAQVFAGDTFLRSQGAVAVTDVNGDAVFRVETEYGQRLEIIDAYDILASDYYKVGTRNTVDDDLVIKSIHLDLSDNPWRVSAGEIINMEAHYEWSEYNKGLAVADAYRYITDFMHTQVVQGDVEQVAVWFPSTDTRTAFFSTRGKIPHLNIPAIDGSSPSVLAHEYGHYAHYLARNKKFFGGGGDHSFCGGPAYNEDTAFSEGYATAFGQTAIDETPLDDPGSPYMTYIDRYGSPPPFATSNVEDFSCSERTMSKQEGRVGAALFDLVDRFLDKFPQFSDNLGRVEVGFNPQLLNARFRPRFIFWLLLQNNPLSIEAYW